MFSRIDMRAIKAIHKQNGGKFFSPNTMRVFNSKVDSHGYFNGQVYLFIESNQPRNGARLYSVRHMDASGNISRIGDFLRTRNEAEAALRARICQQ